MARVKKESTEPTRRSERVQISKAVEKSKLETTAKVAKAKRYRCPRQRKSCRFLALPGELRNRIYTYALVESEKICVTANGPGQPALLGVCRKIRQEASGIYYGKNEFELRVEDYNGAVFVPFERQSWRFLVGLRIPNITFHCGGRADWDNLVAWMKAYAGHQVGVPDKNSEEHLARMITFGDSDDFMLSAVLKIVDAIQWMPWARIEEVLQAYYHGLRGTRSKWIKAEDRLDSWQII